jgi:hypothetical protein
MLEKVKARVPASERAGMVGETFYDKKTELRKIGTPDAVKEIEEIAGPGVRAVV